jgi:tetratricopeptide (TPR) repeat protein
MTARRTEYDKVERSGFPCFRVNDPGRRLDKQLPPRESPVFCILPWIHFLLLTLLIGFSLPCRAAVDADALMAQERLLRGNHLYAEAAGLCERTLVLRPGDHDAELDLAENDAELGRYDKSTPMLEVAVKAWPDDYWLRMRLGEAYIGLGRFDEAKATFALARKLDARKADAYIEEGYADFQAGRPAEAENLFNELIAVDSTSFVGYHHLASLLGKQNRWPEAERNVRESLKRLELDPKSAANDILHSTMWLGGILEGTGRRAEAETLYQNALEKARGDTFWTCGFLSQLGRLCLSDGREAQAKGYFQKVQGAACAGCADCDLARLFSYGGGATISRREGKKNEVEAAADGASTIFPGLKKHVDQFDGDAMALYEIGDALDKSGDDARAEVFYREAIGLGASIWWVEQSDRALAGLCAKSGRPAEAKRLLSDADEIARRRAAVDRARESPAPPR